MGSIPCTLGTGEPVDTNVATIVPKNPADLPALWAFCRSGEFSKSVRKLYSGLKVTSGTLTQVPFDLARWSDVAERENVSFPTPESDDPTQWVFKGAPRGATSPLHVAVARLLGYRWPDQQPDALDNHADKDGIVCLPALRGERPAADRLADLLAAAWGKDWHPQTLTDLLAAVGHQGTLEEWLRDAFFKQHCELFHHRPFVWHVWDGHREGFSALVNYHKLDHEGLKSLTYSYLGDWIRTQEIEAKAGKSGAGDKLAKAKALQQRLAAILEGEAPLDVFVRWKPIEQQPIGWHPDLDDGVRLNIRPFLTVADVGAKGAGVLRWKPNIKWGKDRGKNPPGSPWGEDRDNDKHLTLAEKRAARGET
ncbi:MAG TPA: type II restriction endonuclease [Myxococcota bacterium]|nr:type II restriction endonuclease [Myxococcota bacterium]